MCNVPEDVLALIVLLTRTKSADILFKPESMQYVRDWVNTLIKRPEVDDVPNEVREMLNNMISEWIYQGMDISPLTDWLDNLPTAPEPDWSEAPEWAQWWAMMTACYTWYEDEPELCQTAQWFGWHPVGRFLIGGHVLLPIGIDWRTTLRKRPEVDA